MSSRHTDEIRSPSGCLLLTLTHGDETQWLANLAESSGWDHAAHDGTDALLAHLGRLNDRTGETTTPGTTVVVVAALGFGSRDSCWPLLDFLSSSETSSSSRRRKSATTALRRRRAFCIIFSRTASGDPVLRLDCFKRGANMVSDDRTAVENAFRALERCRPTAGGPREDTRKPRYTCPDCGMCGLTEDQLHMHNPLYHGVKWNSQAPCPACGEDDEWVVHYHNCHGPPEDREPPQSHFAAFSLVVCRAADGRFLMVNEPAALCDNEWPAYWLPAGRLDRGEGFLDAARRETMEEGGVKVRVTGVLRFTLSQHRVPTPRLVLLAEPLMDEPQQSHNPEEPAGTTTAAVAIPSPKTVPDWESVGAMWVASEQLGSLSRKDYRASDPAKYFPAVASGRMVPHPVDTASFKQLEEVIAQLTGDRSLIREQRAREMLRVWEALKADYPHSMFVEH